MADEKPNVTGAVEPPNFTSTPNSFFDVMLPVISSVAELKVTLVIIRQTFGWVDKASKDGARKTEDQLSVTRLIGLTGLSRQAVIDGIKAGLERGTILRRQCGAQDYKYRLNVATPPVKTLDRSKKKTGLTFRPVPVKDLDQSPVYNLDPQKKDEIKEKKGEDANALPPPSPVLNTAESTKSPSQHPAVQTYRNLHRIYPKKAAAKEGELSEMELIAETVGDKPEDLTTWQEALESWRDLALAHNENLPRGQKRWNPSGVESAVRQFAELVAERDFAQRNAAAGIAPETTSDGLVRVEVGGTTFYVQPQAGGAR